MRDAWACWNVETQQWELQGDPYDDARCDDCDGETSIEEMDLEQWKALDAEANENNENKGDKKDANRA